MIDVYNDPMLIDFISVAQRLPQDEIDQIEAMTGRQFEIDGVAIGAYTVQGPKWAAKIGNRALSVGGFNQERPGVWRDFMMNTPESFAPENYVQLTRHCRRIMNMMFKSGSAHRLECIVPLSRITARPELVRWYKAVGYTQEAVMQAYLANKYPAVMFSRIR